MAWFDRFSDWLARVWAGAPWFAFCLGFIAAWLAFGALNGLWSNDTWHLALNSPTTALTFVGVFALHNSTNRFERATNRRLCALLEAFRIDDPVLDSGQKEPDERDERRPGD